MQPSAIRCLDDQQILLLWPPIMKSCGWDSNFFKPIIDGLLPELYVEDTLTQRELDHWLARLQIS